MGGASHSSENVAWLRATALKCASLELVSNYYWLLIPCKGPAGGEKCCCPGHQENQRKTRYLLLLTKVSIQTQKTSQVFYQEGVFNAKVSQTCVYCSRNLSNDSSDFWVYFQSENFERYTSTPLVHSMPPPGEYLSLSDILTQVSQYLSCTCSYNERPGSPPLPFSGLYCTVECA